MPNTTQHPGLRDIASVRATQARLAANIDPVPARDPWDELRRVAMKMAGARSAYALSMAYERSMDDQRRAAAELDAATHAFIRLLAEVETCYAEVPVATCGGCGLRVLKNVRRWPADFEAELGESCYSGECGCGSTLRWRQENGPAKDPRP